MIVDKYNKKLSSREENEELIVRVLHTPSKIAVDNNLAVDLRIFKNGGPTKIGITFEPFEFIWFKDVMKYSFTDEHKLSQYFRKIKIVNNINPLETLDISLEEDNDVEPSYQVLLKITNEE